MSEYFILELLLNLRKEKKLKIILSCKINDYWCIVILVKVKILGLNIDLIIIYFKCKI